MRAVQQQQSQQQQQQAAAAAAAFAAGVPLTPHGVLRRVLSNSEIRRQHEREREVKAAAVGRQQELVKVAILSDKIKEMQFELSQLNRKFREFEEENEQWSLRYSRRLVIAFNGILGLWIFTIRLFKALNQRKADSTLVC